MASTRSKTIPTRITTMESQSTSTDDLTMTGLPAPDTQTQILQRIIEMQSAMRSVEEKVDRIDQIDARLTGLELSLNGDAQWEGAEEEGWDDDEELGACGGRGVVSRLTAAAGAGGGKGEPVNPRTTNQAQQNENGNNSQNGVAANKSGNVASQTYHFRFFEFESDLIDDGWANDDF